MFLTVFPYEARLDRDKRRKYRIAISLEIVMSLLIVAIFVWLFLSIH